MCQHRTCIARYLSAGLSISTALRRACKSQHTMPQYRAGHLLCTCAPTNPYRTCASRCTGAAAEVRLPAALGIVRQGFV
eukprot:2589310-Rhodomonas_salina.4